MMSKWERRIRAQEQRTALSPIPCIVFIEPHSDGFLVTEQYVKTDAKGNVIIGSGRREQRIIANMDNYQIPHGVRSVYDETGMLD